MHYYKISDIYVDGIWTRNIKTNKNITIKYINTYTFEHFIFEINLALDNKITIKTFEYNKTKIKTDSEFEIFKTEIENKKDNIFIKV